MFGKKAATYSDYMIGDLVQRVSEILIENNLIIDDEKEMDTKLGRIKQLIAIIHTNHSLINRVKKEVEAQLTHRIKIINLDNNMNQLSTFNDVLRLLIPVLIYSSFVGEKYYHSRSFSLSSPTTIKYQLKLDEETILTANEIQTLLDEHIKIIGPKMVEVLKGDETSDALIQCANTEGKPGGYIHYDSLFRLCVEVNKHKSLTEPQKIVMIGEIQKLMLQYVKYSVDHTGFILCNLHILDVLNFMAKETDFIKKNTKEKNAILLSFIIAKLNFWDIQCEDEKQNKIDLVKPLITTALQYTQNLSELHELISTIKNPKLFPEQRNLIISLVQEKALNLVQGIIKEENKVDPEVLEKFKSIMDIDSFPTDNNNAVSFTQANRGKIRFVIDQLEEILRERSPSIGY